MKYPKYKLAFPGKHALVFNGHPMTQFDGYTLGTYASGSGVVSASKQKGFLGESAELLQSAAQYHTFEGYSANKGTIEGNTYIFGKGDDIVTAFFKENESDIYNLFLNQTQGGTVTGNPMSGLNGTIVTLSNTANAGYTFNNYSITGANLTGNQFKFSGQNVTVKPNYTHNVYSLELQTDGHGKLVAGKTTGYYQDTTTLTATPSSNYEFSAYKVTGGSINNNIFTWTNTSNATAKAFFVTASVIPMSARVTIGNQTWMKHDLQINDGGPGITTAFTAVDVNPSAYNTYRSRFGTPTFYQLSAAQRIANNTPGWHLPTRDEWQQLIDYVGGTSALISDVCWVDGSGTDPYGFGLLPYTLNTQNADVPPRARLRVGEGAKPWTNTPTGQWWYAPWLLANNNVVWDATNGYDYNTVRLIKDY